MKKINTIKRQGPLTCSFRSEKLALQLLCTQSSSSTSNMATLLNKSNYDIDIRAFKYTYICVCLSIQQEICCFSSFSLVNLFSTMHKYLYAYRKSGKPIFLYQHIFSWREKCKSSFTQLRCREQLIQCHILNVFTALMEQHNYFQLLFRNIDKW